MRKSMFALIALSLLLPLVFFGCSGDDGAAGAPGAPGAPGTPGADGATGPAGPITNTNESCMVCHSTGRLADIANYHANSTAQDVTISITSVENIGGLPRVTVNLKDASGTPININDNSFAANRLSFYIADLVPAGTPTNATLGTQSSPYFKRWANENLTTSGGIQDNTGSAAGNYVYTFKAPFSTLGTAGTDNAYGDLSYTSAAHVQRLAVTWRPIDETKYNRAAANFDFNVPADNTAAVKLDAARMFVTVDTCKKCHGPNMDGAAHASSYRDTRNCVICHSPYYNAAMHDEGVQLSQFIHKIHAALPVEAFPTRINGNGYVDVTYPQDVRNCVTCHNNDSGAAVGAGNLVDNWKNHPTAAVCGSCHEGFPLTSHGGAVHPGGTAQPDSNCAVCHPATGDLNPAVGASITGAHDTSPTSTLNPNPKNVPEFDVTLALTAPANGTHYVAGETFTVTATLKKHSDGTAVPGTLYTTPKDAAGVAGGGLTTASLYVYGPRALPKPILKAQATPMFVSTTDNNVKTDATGFKYQVTVPAGLTAGTYMVRVRMADYGYKSDTDYQMEGVAFQNIQIGSATVTKKVAGDGCVNCHGTGTAPFHDARHVVVFDTDQCISCHDYSGGHAATLSNRVHAVHAENSWGDMNNTYGTTTARQWDDVTYPSNIARCSACHSSGNTSFKTTVHEVACLGCHGDDPATGGATNHLLQNGGDYPEMPPAP
ncbi:MAG: multiheme c-type cytochrome [Deltaproteobacteria bacterium]|nr:hypothetical protein [Candidatus Deferrimicrobiaceae bacterium]